MAGSSERTAPKFSQHDDLRMVAPRSAHRRQLLLLGQQRKSKHLTIEVNRSVEISHVHHDALKVHPCSKSSVERRHHAKPPFTQAAPSIHSVPIIRSTSQP